MQEKKESAVERLRKISESARCTDGSMVARSPDAIAELLESFDACLGIIALYFERKGIAEGMFDPEELAERFGDYGDAEEDGE